MVRRYLSLGGLALAAVLLVAVNMLGGALLKSTRLDLTEGRLFTLSDGTRKILASLEEPITLRFYLSRSLATRLPGISSYASRVEELLEEYARQAGGKITLLEIEPEPFSEEEDRAVGYGLRGVPLDEEDNTLYFGLVGTGATDQEEVIPIFSTTRERFLEYDISRLIYSLAHPKQPVVGLLTPLPINGAGPRAMLQGLSAPPWVVAEQIGQLFEILPVETDSEKIPAEVDVLMVAHPKALSDRTVYAIDQFVMGGGRVLMFVDPNAEADPGGQQPMMGMMAMTSRSSNPQRLLQSWGLRMAADKVVGDLPSAARVRTEREGRAVVLDYPVWMNLSGDALDGEDIVTANLGNLTFASSGYLEALPETALAVTPLVRTSENAALFDVSKVQNYSDPEGLLRSYEAQGQRFTLAARVTGKASSAFPEGQPPKDENETQQDTGSGAATTSEAQSDQHLAQSIGEINVIVVADVDVLHDRFWVQVQDLLGSRIAIPTAANGPFVVNALDNLTGSGELIAIRSQGSFVRPFDRVNLMRQQAELAFREKEQELIRRLEETEQRLTELESQKQGEDAALVLSEAQQRELIGFRQERLQIRKDLREVRRSLREKIEQLEGWLKFVNIGLVPILIGIGGLTVGALQLRRRRASVRAAHG